MEKFTQLTGVAAPMNMINVDTDMIIPKQYLKTIKRTGLGTALFSEMRYDDDGNEREDFVLNKPAYRDAKILVAGENFGCGSSREHAPWALLDYGFRAVISSRFADIFRSNAVKNGLLPVEVEARVAEYLLAHPDCRVAIDIASRTLSIEDYGEVEFPLDPFSAYCLTRGIDQLDFILQGADEISRYEQEHGK